MKKMLLTILLFGALFAAYSFYSKLTHKNKHIEFTPRADARDKVDSNRINENILLASQYAKKHQLNKEIQIVVDFGLHSGLERFYIIQNGKIIKTGCVSHGCGNSPWGKTKSATNAIVSNTNDSHCSSEGHYKIGKRGVSEWGIKVNYILHGLDATNSNAQKRAIVLHSWEEISEKSVYPNGTPEGWGCPAISNELMRYLDSLIKNEKDVLLWCRR